MFGMEWQQTKQFVPIQRFTSKFGMVYSVDEQVAKWGAITQANSATLRENRTAQD